MKKILFLLMAVAINASLFAESDLQIKVTDLPETSQEFLKSYFAQDKVSSVILKRDKGKMCYTVKLASGSTIDFNKKGCWTEVDCGTRAVPDGIVPSPICAFVAGWNPSAVITEVEKDRGHTEITLNTGTEMKFNKKYNVIEVDD